MNDVLDSPINSHQGQVSKGRVPRCWHACLADEHSLSSANNEGNRASLTPPSVPRNGALASCPLKFQKERKLLATYDMIGTYGGVDQVARSALSYRRPIVAGGWVALVSANPRVASRVGAGDSRDPSARIG